MKKCSKCKLDKDESLFNRNKSKKDGYTTECKCCIKEYADKYRLANKEKLLVQSRLFKDAHREKINTKNRLSYIDKRENPSFMSRKRKANSLYKANNKGKVNADTAKRYCVKLKRLSITSDEDLKEIREIYKTSVSMSKETGIQHHVDHVIPLQGKLVSGLHIPSNLQILTEYENCSKHNAFIV